MHLLIVKSFSIHVSKYCQCRVYFKRCRDLNTCFHACMLQDVYRTTVYSVVNLLNASVILWDLCVWLMFFFLFCALSIFIFAQITAGIASNPYNDAEQKKPVRSEQLRQGLNLVCQLGKAV